MGMVGLRDVLVVTPASSFHHTNHHHHHHADGNTSHLIPDHHSLNGSNPATALGVGVGVGVGVIPLLTTTPCLGPVEDDSANVLTGSTASRGRSGGGGGGGGGIQLWQNQHSQQSAHLFKKSGINILDQGINPNLVQTGGGGSVIGSGSCFTTTCQDCGNKAKKDCIHRRCRTCCKSRGFNCATHVKSTWVPAARRRERQLMTAAGAAGGLGSSGSTSGAKKPRLLASQTTTTSHTSTSNTTTRSFDTSSSHQDASFKESLPGQVRAQAVFKCVRVTAVEDGEDEYAYQAVVKIGGHVFKGFLYDQGVEPREGFPNISELHLGGGGGGGGGGERNGASSSLPILDPSDVYAASSGGGLLGGSGYGNPIN